jgi:LPXTG-motif cell wall-anchored protein
MFKKVKSLLIAGLLVFGMGGNAFAAEEGELPATATSTITNPKFEEGLTQRVIELQNGNIVVTLNKDGRVLVKWKSEVIKVTKVNVTFKDETVATQDIYLPGEKPEGQDCHAAQADGEWFKSLIQNSGEIVKVEITFENLTKGDKPVVPPVVPPVTPPEEEIVDPETGDVNTMVILGISALSAGAVLVLTNRKKDEE